jgi:hypothetical protein
MNETCKMAELMFVDVRVPPHLVSRRVIAKTVPHISNTSRGWWPVGRRAQAFR